MAFGRTYGVMPRLRGRVSALKNRLVRVRYFRGHGVHSPFVYTIVRKVFMSTKLFAESTRLYDALIRRGVSVRRARELQNLMNHCGYRTFILCGDSVPMEHGNRQGAGRPGYSVETRNAVSDSVVSELYILLGGLSEQETLGLIDEASNREATVVVMAPYSSWERERMCYSIVASHRSTTVDNRGYLLIFNDKHLPKQHFRI